MFIGSADLMPRNLDHRVECVTEVMDRDLKDRLDEILQVNLDDDVLAWELGPDGWGRVPTDARAGDAHVPAAAGGGVRQVTSTLEREVKLAASPAFRMPSLDELGDDVLTIPRDPERLQTVYFDTPDFRLARWGVSLRHREGQGWTTKLPAEDAGGDLLIRGEFTFPGEDPIDTRPTRPSL